MVSYDLQLDYIKIDFIEQNIPLINDELKLMGEIVEFNRNENIIKVKIATDSPGVVVNASQKYGEFLDIKIDTITETEKAEELVLKDLRKMSARKKEIEDE